MTKLDWNHKRLIVKLLATGADPAEIVDELYTSSLIRATPEEIRAFDRRASGGGLTGDLTRLYKETRSEHGGEAVTETVFVKAAAADDLVEGAGLAVEVDGREIALFRQHDAYFALDNTCTHQGGPLCEGAVQEGEVECPWHGARFKLSSGEATQAPAPDAVRAYEVRVEEGALLVGIETTADR